MWNGLRQVQQRWRVPAMTVQQPVEPAMNIRNRTTRALAIYVCKSVISSTYRVLASMEVTMEVTEAIIMAYTSPPPASMNT